MRATRPGTIEHWCRELMLADTAEHKLDPGTPPDAALDTSWEDAPPPRRLAAPGRPSEWELSTRSPRLPRSLHTPLARARVLHTFAHHELQAAELFAWAVLAFPDTPRAFRVGLVGLAREELAHRRLYLRRLAELGHGMGDFPLRDWFWERVPRVTRPEGFTALVGLGLEAANLEHSARFAAAFRDAGDESSARLLERVEREEIGHVRFGKTWFEHFTGRALVYETWRDALPRPLSPSVLQGRPLNRAARREAGLSDAFLDRLVAEPATTEASPR